MALPCLKQPSTWMEADVSVALADLSCGSLTETISWWQAHELFFGFTLIRLANRPNFPKIVERDSDSAYCQGSKMVPYSYIGQNYYINLSSHPSGMAPFHRPAREMGHERDTANSRPLAHRAGHLPPTAAALEDPNQGV